MLWVLYQKDILCGSMSNEEEKYQPLDEEIQNLAKIWGLPKNIEWQQIKKGRDNTSFILTTPKKEYVLRVYRQNSSNKEDIDKEVAFMNHLHRNKMPVPEVIRTTSGDSFASFIGDDLEWNAILMEKLKGKHSTDYTKEIVQEIGKILALMHILGMDSPGITLCKYQDPVIDEEVQAAQFTNEMDPFNVAFFKEAQEYTIKIDHELPRGILHRDITKSNTLFEGNTITGILDFSSIRCGYFVEDIGVVVWGIIYNHLTKFAPISLIKDFLTAYAAIRPISPEEFSYLNKFVVLRNYVIAATDYKVNGDITDSILVQSYLEKIAG